MIFNIINYTVPPVPPLKSFKFLPIELQQRFNYCFGRENMHRYLNSYSSLK